MCGPKMKWNIVNVNGKVGKRSADAGEVEGMLRVLTSDGVDKLRFVLEARLPFNLDAVVIRDRKKENVELKRFDNGWRYVVERSVGSSKNGLGVSCNPNGEKVPIESINLKFRSINDQYTD